MGLSLIFVTGFLVGSFLFSQSRLPADHEYSPVTHLGIFISGNADFARCECVRSGLGTEREPYIISDWKINASGSDGISIIGCTAYFVIKKVEIHGDSAHVGIRLSGVENAKIEESLITDNLVGVYTFTSSNLVLKSNSISKNQFGVRLEASDDNTLESNNFDGNSQIAIFVRGSRNLLKNNRIANGTFGGINIDGTIGSATDNLIEANVITDGSSYGIGMWRAADCILRGNTVSRNLGIGILLTDASNNNAVDANNVTENRGTGILVTHSSSNHLEGNTAKDNGDGVESFDLEDAGADNIWRNNIYRTKKPDTLT